MTIWKPAGIEDQPEVELVSWRIFSVQSRLWAGTTAHFVGLSAGDEEGRVSSQIIEFDCARRRGKTASGRIYSLVGSPGDGSADGMYTWRWWCVRNQVFCQVDVTEDFVAVPENYVS